MESPIAPRFRQPLTHTDVAPVVRAMTPLPCDDRAAAALLFLAYSTQFDVCARAHGFFSAMPGLDRPMRDGEGLGAHTATPRENAYSASGATATVAREAPPPIVTT